jgi:hypothetical protein
MHKTLRKLGRLAFLAMPLAFCLPVYVEQPHSVPPSSPSAADNVAQGEERAERQQFREERQKIRDEHEHLQSERDQNITIDTAQI